MVQALARSFTAAITGWIVCSRLIAIRDSCQPLATADFIRQIASADDGDKETVIRQEAVMVPICDCASGGARHGRCDIVSQLEILSIGPLPP